MIKLAKILSINDIDREGTFLAQIISADSEEVIRVNYTSPFLTIPNKKESYTFAGFFGVPNENSFILVWYGEDTTSHYYLTTLAVPPLAPKTESADNIQGTTAGKYIVPTPGGDNPKNGPYSHSTEPQKIIVQSPKGASVTLSDSANSIEANEFVKIESMTNKKVMQDDRTDYSSMENEHGDGFKCTGPTYGWRNAPGPGAGSRSAQIQTKGNVFIESDNGSMNAQVKGGYQMNFQNQSINHPITRPTALDTKVGELNIESFSNSINIHAFGKEFTYGGSNGISKGIFIDASDYMGVVQIRAGRGGVEIWSNGDIDFNCNGNFNVNAAGDINLKAKSARAFGYWGNVINPAPPITTPGPGHVNLNPPDVPGIKVTPTKNNDELFPIN